MECNEKCFACERPLSLRPGLADTVDGQRVYVGRDCFLKIIAAGSAGYQPPKGGPVLYPLPGSNRAIQERLRKDGCYRMVG
jgi:hypothetical protein